MHISIDRRTILRGAIRRLEVHDTQDVRRLLAKLRQPGEKLLIESAEGLIRSEGLLSEYKDVDITIVRASLDMLLDIQVGREDILSWIRDFREELLKTYTFARLDWLWDFSWSYSLWGQGYFRSRDILVYGAVRGPTPEGLHRIPFQAVLNGIRKGLIKKWERSLFGAAKRGELEDLIALGLSEEQAQRAIEKVVRASV